ncbi:MAG: repair protein radA protein [Berkelbacteria bacterium GW2011_GWA1_36_9]|uniref:DNA repair protein RadA n=2 Tax=Candidatus Berkelbacteria TaxID=1618330 RepID=A0A0G0FYI2_9BACT|nr:MAG: repair protein radA protein [Berkelbacteria bacterium GW2011_GWA1_36_9]
MSSEQIIFNCADCGQEYFKWQGRCDRCGAWNTLKEMRFSKESVRTNFLGANQTEPTEISKINIKNITRIKTGLNEFDRVLGGGIVPGSIFILGGDPGIGKSTLLLQISALVKNVLYISGEESLEQIKLRFERLGLHSSVGGIKLKLYNETNIDVIAKKIQAEKPELAIIDSIQTVYLENIPAAAGSIAQVKECAMKLQQLAKSTQTAVALVGHVTKDGAVAGPRTLEHLVDAVLYLEGERFHEHRILRGVKNRFGTTDEIGIFEMTEKGLMEVKNPSKLFLAERLSNTAGTVVTATIEGSRSLLVEVQALTATTVFGYPQRRTSGFDLNRLQLLVAVLQKKAGINIANQDIFVNIVGGVKIIEPAVDLAVVLAIASASRGKVIDPKLCVFGELGLSGEIRRVSREEKRKAEAERLGFNKFIKEKTILEAVRRYCV